LPPIRAAVSAAFSSDLAMEVCAPTRKILDSTKQTKSICTVGQVSDLPISGDFFQKPLSLCGGSGVRIRPAVEAVTWRPFTERIPLQSWADSSQAASRLILPNAPACRLTRHLWIHSAIAVGGESTDRTTCGCGKLHSSREMASVPKMAMQLLTVSCSEHDDLRSSVELASALRWFPT
jgi:hypothetical protein